MYYYLANRILRTVQKKQRLLAVRTSFPLYRAVVASPISISIAIAIAIVIAVAIVI